MAVENDPPVRPPGRLPPPRTLGLVLAVALALSLVVIALWRFIPALLPASALLLAWGAAQYWVMARAARRQARASGGVTPRFASPPAERSEPAVAAPPVPSNIHSIVRDPLTGLFLRGYFEASVRREIHRMERRNLPLGVVLMRVDQEPAGRSEELLRAVGALLDRRVRGGDVASHHGGGTFGLILPEAPLGGVQTRAEQLRNAVREIRLGEGQHPVEITLSLGVAAFPDSGNSSEKLLHAARSALDEALAGGGDRVTVAPGAVLDRRLMLPD